MKNKLLIFITIAIIIGNIYCLEPEIMAVDFEQTQNKIENLLSNEGIDSLLVDSLLVRIKLKRPYQINNKSIPIITNREERCTYPIDCSFIPSIPDSIREKLLPLMNETLFMYYSQQDSLEVIIPLEIKQINVIIR
jgi:hypothetical protein